jgi:DNA-binding GntR family transcriptional regulator
VELRWKHVKVRDTIRRRISDGTYPVGSAIPGVGALAEEFAVARQTVLHALQPLQYEGILDPRPGVGTIVLRKPDEPEKPA